MSARQVDPILEIAEITDRVSKIGRSGTAAKGKKSYAPGGPALLFENIKGHPGHRVLMNQFGSERRMQLALGVNSLDEVAARIQGMMQIKSPDRLFRQAEDAADAGRGGQVLSQNGSGEGCAVQGSDPQGELQPAGFSGAAVLADGWRTLHYAALRDYARPEERQAQRRNVPHAGVRRADDGHALAAAEGCSGTFSQSPAQCGGAECYRTTLQRPA